MTAGCAGLTGNRKQRPARWMIARHRLAVGCRLADGRKLGARVPVGRWVSAWRQAVALPGRCRPERSMYFLQLVTRQRGTAAATRAARWEPSGSRP